MKFKHSAILLVTIFSMVIMLCSCQQCFSIDESAVSLFETTGVLPPVNTPSAAVPTETKPSITIPSVLILSPTETMSLHEKESIRTVSL